MTVGVTALKPTKVASPRPLSRVIVFAELTFQARVVDPPEFILEGFAEKLVITGGGAAFGLIV